MTDLEINRNESNPFNLAVETLSKLFMRMRKNFQLFFYCFIVIG